MTETDPSSPPINGISWAASTALVVVSDAELSLDDGFVYNGASVLVAVAISLAAVVVGREFQYLQQEQQSFDGIEEERLEDWDQRMQDAMKRTQQHEGPGEPKQ